MAQGQQQVMSPNANKFDTSGITKLKGRDNYSLWVYEIQTMLAAFNLERWITKDDPPQDEGLSSEDLAARTKCLLVLLRTINSSEKTRILRCSTPRQVWKTFESLYVSTQLKTRVQASREFHALTFTKSNLSMMEYLNKFEKLQADVHVAGGTISDDTLVTTVIGSMATAED